MGAHVSMKLATKASFGGQRTLHFWTTFGDEKTEECDQKILNLSDKFGRLMSGLNPYFLEVGVHALLKIAIKNSFRGEKSRNLPLSGYFSKVKIDECD